MGGAVVVSANDPTWTTEAAIGGDVAGSSETGNFGSGAFMLSGPMVGNQLAFRVAGQYFEDESGIAYADPLNEDLGQGYFGQLRAKFLLTPAALDGFEALFTISRTSDWPSVSAVTGPDFFARRFATLPPRLRMSRATFPTLTSMPPALAAFPKMASPPP